METRRDPRPAPRPMLFLLGAMVGAAAASLVAIGVIAGLWKVGVMAAHDERLPPLASYLGELDRKVRQLAANEQGRAELKDLQTRLAYAEALLNSPRAAAGEKALAHIEPIEARLADAEAWLKSPRAAAGEKALAQVEQMEPRLADAEAALIALGIVPESAAQGTFENLANAGGAISIQAAKEWRVAAIADFNGDGKADILWRHLNGTTNIFLMDGTTVLGGSGTTRQFGTEWQIRGVGDFNGDGRADIVWRRSDGSTIIWLMEGVTVLDDIAVPDSK